MIPEALWREVVIEGEGQAEAGEIKASPWIKTKLVRNTQLAQALRQELDPGEAEAIALAVEAEAQLLLMDDRIGRDSARHLGLHFTGLVGVLIEAKKKGFIEAVKPDLDALRDKAGFRLDEVLYTRVLRDEGEV